MCKWDSRLEPGLCWLWFPCTKPFPVLLPCSKDRENLPIGKAGFLSAFMRLVSQYAAPQSVCRRSMLSSADLALASRSGNAGQKSAFEICRFRRADTVVCLGSKDSQRDLHTSSLQPSMLTPLRILRALDHAQQTYSEVQSPDVPTCRYAGCIRTGPTTWRPSALSCSRPSSPWAQMAGNTLRKRIGSKSLSKARTVSLLGNWIGAIITILRLNNFCKRCVLSQEVECCRLRQSVVRLRRMDAFARS